MFAVVMLTVGNAVAQDGSCGEAALYRLRARATGGVFSRDDAGPMADRLLHAIASNPGGQCLDELVDAAIVVLPQCQRDAEAIPVVDLALSNAADPHRRAILANAIVALTTKTIRPLTPEARAVCRDAATCGLAGSPTLESLLGADSLDHLATLMPLHHVRASTEASAADRIASLSALMETCRAAEGVANSAGRVSPVRMDLYSVAKEIIEERIAAGTIANGSDLAPIVLSVPWDGHHSFTAAGLVLNVAQAANLTVRQKQEFLAAVAASAPDAGVMFRAKYAVLINPRRTPSRELDEASAVAFYQELASLWEDVVAIEAAGGPSAVGLRADSWDGSVHTILTLMWEIGYKRLGRCDLLALPATEHVRRYPEMNPSGQMTRHLARCGM